MPNDQNVQKNSFASRMWHCYASEKRKIWSHWDKTWWWYTYCWRGSQSKLLMVRKPLFRNLLFRNKKNIGWLLGAGDVASAFWQSQWDVGMIGVGWELVDLISTPLCCFFFHTHFILINSIRVMGLLVLLITICLFYGCKNTTFPWENQEKYVL